MRLSIYFSFLVFVTSYSQTRISSDAKTIDTPKTLPKTDSTKITSRSTNEADQVFTIRTGADGKASQTCRCVFDYSCDTEDVYIPSESESHIKCEGRKKCCTRPKLSDDPQSAATNSQNNGADRCVAPTQCDANALKDSYGLDLIDVRSDGFKSTFPECPIGQVKCPADKVLSDVINPVLPPPEVCICTSLANCGAEFGANKLKEKISQCDTTEVCCPTALIRTFGQPDPAPPTNTAECGIKKDAIHTKLAGFAETAFGEFPWMIVILERVNGKEKVKCGGSLVSTNLVLTAAHCLENRSMDSFIVRAGEHNLNLSSSLEELPHQDRVIKNITMHYAFYRKLLLHDLALIEVSEPFQYSPHVAPVCLPLVESLYSPEDASIYDLNRCVAAGWGSKDTGDPAPSTKLNKIDLKLIPSDRCVAMLRKSPLGPKFILHQSLICAMGNPGVDTCKGDGGGPLACPLKSNPNKYVQVGVIAGGLACSSPFPGLYASLLLSNAAWISDAIYFKHIFSV